MVKRILSIGECLVELSQAGGGLLRKGFAGDTFNTAYYLRALLPAACTVDYFTALGTDPVSDEMIAFMRGAGIGTGLIRRVPHRRPGLYMIQLDRQGERSFTYWRSDSAARLLADDVPALRAAIEAADLVYFSGITLAILAPAAAAALLAELGRARQAGRLVTFDPNIRPLLWPDADAMRRTLAAGARVATVAMPGFEDEATHFGDASVAATIERYRALGAENLVVKNGADGITLDFGGERSFVAAVPAPEVVDTTGAGDSFNGAFLAAWTQGAAPRRAAELAAAVAAKVVGQHGALAETGLSAQSVGQAIAQGR